MKPLPPIALAQINVTVGELDGNARRILAAREKAATLGAELAVFPEAALIGYPPEDLLLMPSFQQAAMQAMEALAKHTVNGPAMIVGGIWQLEGKLSNCAFLLDEGRIGHIVAKKHLPNYGVFDEKRVFVAGKLPEPVIWKGHKLGLLVCEDIWAPGPVENLTAAGAELLIAINASPFEQGKMHRRHKLVARIVEQTQLPLIYVNLIGGQDDIVFDGGSFAVNAAGETLAQLPEFLEAVELLGFHARAEMSDQERIWQACMLGLKEYVGKNGFDTIVLGLSGGIDSAITAAMAVDALGADKVKGVLLSSPYTSRESVQDAEESAKLLGIETLSIPIAPGMALFEELLSPTMGEGWMESPSIGGNLQARLRGLTLMALSNRFGWMLLNTSNKSELAVGYSTLYGDSCGSYSLLKDIYKTEIYALAQWRKLKGKVIPQRSITKAPSAELKPDQTDQDQLPPYELLDAILQAHLEGRLGLDEIVAKGFDAAIVSRVLQLVRNSEYKRRQSCPGVKISMMQFGRDRRFPLTNGWKA